MIKTYVNQITSDPQTNTLLNCKRESLKPVNAD